MKKMLIAICTAALATASLAASLHPKVTFKVGKLDTPYDNPDVCRFEEGKVRIKVYDPCDGSTHTCRLNKSIQLHGGTMTYWVSYDGNKEEDGYTWVFDGKVENDVVVGFRDTTIKLKFKLQVKESRIEIKYDVGRASEVAKISHLKCRARPGSDTYSLDRNLCMKLASFDRPTILNTPRDWVFKGWWTAETGGREIKFKGDRISATADGKLIGRTVHDHESRDLYSMTLIARWQKPGALNWIVEEEEGAEPPSFVKAMTFSSYLKAADGGLAGTATVKTGKEKGGIVPTTVAMQPLGGKKRTLKGNVSAADGSGQGALAGLKLLAGGVSGTLDGQALDGSEDVAKSKQADVAAVLDAFKGKTYTMALTTADDAGLAAGLSVTFRAKGKAKVSGTLPDGSKVSASANLVVGKNLCCLPVACSKKDSFGFVMWFDREGRFQYVNGATAWKKGGSEVEWSGDMAAAALGGATPPEGTCLNVEGLPDEIGGAPVVKRLLPVNVDMAVGWAVAKAASVKIDGNGIISYGANPAQVKLKYAPKTGLFTGSFVIHTLANGKLKKTKATVNGAVVDGVGRGTAVAKGVGAWPVAIDTKKIEIEEEEDTARAESMDAVVLPGDDPVESTDGTLSTDDFDVRITGVAVLNKYFDWYKTQTDLSQLSYVAPQKTLEIPRGKCVVFRVECDFPAGYGGDMHVDPEWSAGEEGDSGGFWCNPFGGLDRCKEKGVAYCCMGRDVKNGGDLNVRRVAVKIRADPNPEGFPVYTYDGKTQPTAWKVKITYVDLWFRAR